MKRLEKIAKDTEITRTTPISDAVAQLNLGAQYGPGIIESDKITAYSPLNLSC